MDREKLFLTRTREGAGRTLFGLLEGGRLLEKVSPRFKVVISDLRHFLEETKQKLDEEESRTRIEEEEGARRQIEKEILDDVQGIAAGFINPLILEMNEIARHFAQAEHHLHRNYFQHHLHALLLTSPFVRRAYLKPLGFPGDYEVMNMIYGDHDQGETLFAQLMNRYFCQVTAARSVMGRVPYMTEKMNHLIERTLQRKEIVSMTSVGAGPAREIQELIKTNPQSGQCHVTLIDIAAEALWYCHSTLLDLKEATGSRIRVDFLNRFFSSSLTFK
jgi:extracellular factor (EF) 3-hydroxypalmitic acid methyl ester biosynthesis protein